MSPDVTTTAPPLSPRERRQRNRNEVIDSILSAARGVMREQGVASLNLNEVARRVGMRTPSLYEYFPSKTALYEALYETGIRLFREADAQVWKDYPPGWARLEAWFQTRLTLAMEHPDLYHHVFDAPVPGFTPTEAGMRDAVQIGVDAVKALGEMIDAGVIAPGIPADRALDLLLALRHGIIAETLGKEIATPPVSERFATLVPIAIGVLQAAWDPRRATGSEGGATG